MQVGEEAGGGKLYRVALQLRKLTREAKIPLIVNDRLDIALAVDADGVHVGPEDLPVSVARRILGPGKILGVSTETEEEALAIAIPPIPFKNALSRFFQRPPAPTVATPDAPVRPSAREKTLQEVFDRIRRLNPKENEK